MPEPTNNQDTLDYLTKSVLAIGERVVKDKLDYEQDKRYSKLNPTPMVTPQVVTPQSGIPKWVIPTAIAGAVVLLVILLKKK